MRRPSPSSAILFLGALLALVGGDPAGASAQAAPSLQLTASDGSGLDLVALDARGVLEGPLAFTELRLTFQNPRPEQIEGRFQIRLPPGAVISRFAMKLDTHWQEGEVVERQQARRIYEDFLHRRQDPALLEQEAGNQFSARVFPIPAHGSKELVVSYSHALTRAEDPYVIPLRGLSQIDQLDVRVLIGSRADDDVVSNLGGSVSDQRLFELHKTDWVPDRDVEVRQDPATRHGLRHGNLVALRLEPQVEAPDARDEIDGLAILVDSSASRALDHAAQVSNVAELLASLDADTPVSVAAFDQEVVPIYQGRAGGFGQQQTQELRDHGALGASDLVAALGWLAARQSVPPRLLLLTDGVATAGDAEAESPVTHLETARDVLARAGVRRIDVLAFGGLRDEAVLRRLVAGSDGSVSGAALDAGRVIDGREGVGEILRRLRRPCASGLEVVVEGAEWIWPQTLDGIQTGDQVLVYADVPADRPVRVSVGGTRVAFPGATGSESELVLAATERPLLHRAWIQARMDRLLHLRATAYADDPDMARALASEITQLSIENRVLSPFTAFLVLETEDDYRRYELDRRGLADILTVGPAGLEVVERSYSPPQPGAGTPPARARSRQPDPGPDTGNLVGTVVDGDTSRVPGATLRLLGSDGVERTTSSDESGGFQFLDLQPGEYRIVAELEGFATVEYPNLAVVANRNTAVEIMLDVAEILEAITVGAAEGPLVEESDFLAGAMEQLKVLGYLDGVGAGDLEPEPERALFPASSPAEVDESPRPVRSLPAEDARVPPARLVPVAESEPPEEREPPHTGRFAEVVELLGSGRAREALTEAEAWVAAEPGDVLSLVALGDACEATGDATRAARAYGSLIDLFPSRADLRRYAGERLDRLAARSGDAAAGALAIDTYRRALQQRPDHPSGHRLLAWALAAAGRYADAFAVLEAALGRDFPPDRFEGVDRVLKEDLGLLAAALLATDEAQPVELRARLRALSVVIADAPSLRFVLTWETDANDVDLHLWDAHGNHASYQDMHLASGGELFADITTGYGPECIAISGAGKAAPYRIQAHYYSRGAMGYGLGSLDIVEHDGKGGLRVEHRPFVIMVDDGWVELGQWPRN